MPTTVVNKHVEDFDVYIGRPGPWGNPFIIGRDGDRNTVIMKFAKWLIRSPNPRAQWMREHIRELHDKRLGCFCSPDKCHGDVLAWTAIRFSSNHEHDQFWSECDRKWSRQSAAYASLNMEY